MRRFARHLALGGCIAATLCAPVRAQSVPEISGVWMRPPKDATAPELLVPSASEPPLKPGLKQQYDAQRTRERAAEARGEPLDSDRSNCIPDGFPRMMSSTLPIEIIETTGKIVLVVEFETQVRHIYTDRATHPAPDDLEFNYFGDSIAHRDGATLIVDTVGIQKSTPLFDGVPHGEQLRVNEQLRLVTPDVLEDRITITDPETLTEPWTVARRYVRRSDLRLREFVCQENNRTYNKNGTIGITIRKK